MIVTEVLFVKKKFSLFTIIFVVISALIAILALFGAFKLTGAIADLLFTCLTLSVAGLLTLNSCTMLERKNKLAIVSLSLIAASALLVIIALWSNVASSDLYMDITLTICILSVCFNLITSNILKLQKRYLYIQIAAYVCFIVIAGYLIAASWGTDIFDKGSKIFILFLILSLLGMGILAVLSKKQPADQTDSNQDYIRISKKEYEELLNAKKELEKLKESK